MARGIDQITREIKWVDINSIKEYEKNPKKHTEEQVSKLAYTFDKYGFDVPIVVDKDYCIIKGHARRRAAKRLKWKRVPIIVRDDLTPQQVKAARISDNRVAESHWDMPALLEELEALYSLDDPMLPVTDTGFSEDEIRSFLPGLMESEDAEYKIPHGGDGILTGYSIRIQQDGKVGRSDYYIEKKSDEEVISSFDTIIIPTYGSAISIASALKIRELNKDKKLIFIYSHPGTVQFQENIPYMNTLSEFFDGEFIDVSPDSDSEFRGRIPTQGYPSKENLWCESGMVIPQIENYLRSNDLLNEKTVIVLGATVEQSDIFRRIGRFEGSYYYFAPFIEWEDDNIIEYLSEAMPDDLSLHPLYKNFTMIACPNCPLYKSPDFAYMKNHRLDIWMQVLEYFSYGKRDRSYRYSDNFDFMLKSIIAESIDERVILPFEDLVKEV